jgi:release factor glutamine methyltransferase
MDNADKPGILEPKSVLGSELWLWRQQARQQAIAAAIPPDEVDWLLQELAGLDRLSLRLESFKGKSAIDLRLPFAELVQLWQQRLEARVPVQYLVGFTLWRNFRLQVCPSVLIPRPETEILVDLTARVVQSDITLAQGDWADLGTGSGAIALGLADLLSDATIHAVDQSQAVLAIAQANAQQLGLADRIHFYQGSWFQPLHRLQGRLNGMVSNPPYIPVGMLPDLQPEVARHEPRLALDGGIDGLESIRHLVATAPAYLRSGGIWLIEMMAGQAEVVTTLLQQQGSYQEIRIHADLAGIDRFALAYRQ